MKFVIIIPAYNEEKTIYRVVKESLKYSDVLVVDDGSTDGTSHRAMNAGARVLKHDDNGGKGAAIKTGLKDALERGYEIMVLMDGDGQHDPGYIPHLVRELGKAGMLVSSRFIEGTPQGMALQRRLSNMLTTGLLAQITGYQITDSQCGFRAISADAARIFSEITYDDYEFESEMLYQASRHNLLIKEMSIPSTYQGEKSHITRIKVLKYIFFVLKLIIRDIKWRIHH